MKRTTILASIWLFALASNPIVAQSTNSLTPTNAGLSIRGVQLSMLVSNNIVVAGSYSTLSFSATNASTNVFYLIDAHELTDLRVSLSGSLGKEIMLKEPLPTSGLIQLPPFSFSQIRIPPGGNWAWTTQVHFPKEIVPGNYRLKATRGVWTTNDGDNFSLESNVIQVQVK